MKKTNISYLKQQLSSCIKAVREGEEFVVLDRKKPVAILRPYSSGPTTDERDSLIADGILRPAERPKGTTPLPPPLPLKGPALSTYIEEERSER